MQPQEFKKRGVKKKDMVMFSTFDKMPEDCPTDECALCLVEFLPKKIKPNSSLSNFIETFKKPINDYFRMPFENQACNNKDQVNMQVPGDKIQKIKKIKRTLPQIF